MDILLDTHALIWYVEGDSAINTKARFLIDNQENDVFVSIASFYEIAI